jgi:hypothetical protein
VDAKFIQGLLNNPDLQPDAAVNRWIQGILMFHFELIHVPAVRFQGPDALSRRGLAEGEIAEDDDDSWLDRIALLAQNKPKSVFRSITASAKTGYYRLPVVNFIGHEKLQQTTEKDILVGMRSEEQSLSTPRYFQSVYQDYERQDEYSIQELPSCHLSRIAQELQLQQIRKFLQTLEMPELESVQKQRRFIAKATEFMEREGRLWKRNGTDPLLAVIFEPKSRLSVLRQGHENLGHKGMRAMWEQLKI